MNLPQAVYTLAFWKALTFAVAGLLALLGYFDVIPDTFVYSADALLALVLTVLNFFNIYPEIQARLLDARLKRAERLVEEASVIRNDLLDLKKSSATKKVNK